MHLQIIGVELISLQMKMGGGDSEESDTATTMHKIDIVEENASPSASNKNLTNHDSQTLCF